MYVSPARQDALNADAGCLGLMLIRLLDGAPELFVDAVATPGRDDGSTNLWGGSSSGSKSSRRSRQHGYDQPVQRARKLACGFQLIGAKLLPWLPSAVVTALHVRPARSR